MAIPTLESIDLRATRIENGDLGIKPNRHLKWFCGAHTLLGDQAASELSRCRMLEVLDLDRTAITDRGVAQLARLKRLRRLDLNRVPVSLVAVQKLAKALPNCFITYQPLVLDSNGRVNHIATMQGARSFGGKNKYTYSSLAPMQTRTFSTRSR